MQIKKENKVFGVVATSAIEKTRTVCPTDEEFALFTERKLKEDKKKTLVSHFISCRECRERLTIPVHPLDISEKPKPWESFFSFLWRPLVAAPVAVAFIAVVALTLNVYLSQDMPKEGYEESYRDTSLVALKQINLTPTLLEAIRRGDEEGLKNELIKELPAGSQVSDVVIDDELKYVKGVEEGDKVNLALYSDGVLKVKGE